eukprot:3229753-Prymnesium_polylepis.1
MCAVCGQKAGEMSAERPNPTATFLIRIAESCLSCVWAGHPVDHHDGVDWEGRRFIVHPPKLAQSRR